MRQLPLPDKKPRPESDAVDDYRKDRDLAQYDVLYFLECLGKDRNTHYSDCGRPDVENRHEPRPDRLAIDDITGRHLVVEYTELRIAEEMPRMRHDLERFGFTVPPVLGGEELAKKLTEAIAQKREKNQFVQYPSAEKVMLLRDWVSSAHRRREFDQCSQYFKPPGNPGCDHCYILLRKNGGIIELF